MNRKIVGLWALVVVLAGLGLGTITNQLKINDANARLAAQAMNGQRSLNRTCQLLPVSRKIYTDALKRGVVNADDYDLVLSTATRVCAGASKP